jgi:hypothetical protein
MKWLNGYRMRLVLVGVVAVIVLESGHTKADFIFGDPTPLEATINSGGHPWFDCISSDGLELYLDKPINGKAMSENWDLYVSTRPATNDPWSVPESMGPTVNSSYFDCSACLSSDDLELYFASNRPGGEGGSDLWITNRPTRFDPWDSPENLGPTINTSNRDDTPWITPDGLELYFSSTRPGGYGEDDIWISQRASKNDPWQTPVNLGPVVNSTKSDAHPCLSPDGLVLFFSDYAYTSGGPFRPGGLGLSDMWMTRRKSITDPWEPPVNLGPELNSNTQDPQPRLSSDGSILYFTSWRSGGPAYGFNIWQAPIIPIVDLNGDGIVNSADMCIVVDYWGTGEALCDIGPMPWGDGIVDVQDLIVLAEHLFEEFPPVGPVE